MEAASLYQRFKDNLQTINMLLDKGTDIRTTPYKITLPLEIKLLQDVINHVGGNIQIKTDGFAAIEELQRVYLQNERSVNETMERILSDKRTSMKTPEGRILIKEILIRRLEYFNETARSLMVMSNQTTLKSPVQHIHPHHREDLIHPPLK